MKAAQTSESLENQIEVLEKILYRFREYPYPSAYYAIKGKIKKLRTKLSDIYKDEWLSR
jgi:hypothetical protein